MILALNIGNTNIHAAIGENQPERQVVAYLHELPTGESFVRFIEQNFGRDVWERLEGSIVASVVPERTPGIVEMIQSKTGALPMRVGTDSPGGLCLSRYKNTPGEDRIVSCVGALQTHSAPLIVIDFGTASTINVVDAGSRFIGGAILPGPYIGLDALASKTAQLPKIENLDEAAPLIGTGTRENLISGAVLGAAFAAEGYVRRIKQQIGQDAPVIVTGGHAPIILPYCEFEYIHQPNLLLSGLFALAADEGGERQQTQ